jgi:hypothetical protein
MVPVYYGGTLGVAWSYASGGGGGGGLELTDGTNDVVGVAKITVIGGTVGGSTPNATLTVTAALSTQDEGTPLSSTVNTINFVGAGVTASGAGATTTVTIPGSSGSSLGWVNVKDHGALGDDSHDDTSAITAAIAALPVGGTLYFPAGTYKITSTITVNVAGVVVLGDGSEYSGSVIHMTTANTTALIFAPSWDGTRDQTCLMRGIWVKGPSPRYGASSGYGVSAASDVHLENCAISAFYIGLYWYSATYYSRAVGCFFTDCTYAGIKLVGTNNITVEMCRFIGAYSTTGDLGGIQYGIRGENAGGSVRILNCSIEYCGVSGLYIDGAGATEMLGNWFENTGQAGSGGSHINLGYSASTTATLIENSTLTGTSITGFIPVIMDHATNTTFISNNVDAVYSGGVFSSTANTSNVVLIGHNGSTAGSLPAGSTYIVDPTTSLPVLLSSLGTMVYAGPTAGTTDCALASAGTTASGTNWSSASNAIDGNPSTFARLNYPNSNPLHLDLGTARIIGAATIIGQGPAVPVTIQYSTDDSNWFTAGSLTTTAGGSNHTDSVTFATTHSARYWRFAGTPPSATWYAATVSLFSSGVTVAALAPGADSTVLTIDPTTHLPSWQTLVTFGSTSPIGGGFITLLVFDSTALTGGLYAWNGSDYVKVTP